MMPGSFQLLSRGAFVVLLSHGPSHDFSEKDRNQGMLNRNNSEAIDPVTDIYNRGLILLIVLQVE